MEKGSRPALTLGAAARVWLRIGLLSFGGPAGQIALMHRELVEKRRWVDEQRFLHALNYCMLLPGPEAQQLATYIGWLMHRTPGGLIAGGLFILPGAITMLCLSALYAQFHTLPVAAGVLFGLKAAVFAIVIEALQRIAKRALKGRVSFLFAAAAFVGIFLFGIPFPVIVLAAGVSGWLLNRADPSLFALKQPEGVAGSEQTIIDAMAARGELAHTQPSWQRSLGVVIVWGTLWALPLLLAVVLVGRGSVLVQAGLFFSKAAVVTFGGAYAVLSYVAQQVVDTYGWLRPAEMVDGLGLAETTPGPLILVLQFVGFLAAYRDAHDVSPLLAGTLGALMTLWVTFVPCFLWIFLGAPYIEKLRGNTALHAALSGITAAVVGVILNLSVWFGMHVLFGTVEEVAWGPLATRLPLLSSLNPAAAVLSALAVLLLFRFHWSVPRLLAICGALGAFRTLF